jgi:hypothetical protein
MPLVVTSAAITVQRSCRELTTAAATAATVGTEIT